MVTIKDIAKHTNVSPTTVSNVIHGRLEKVSPETRIKVERALHELNYTSNMAGRLLANHGSKIIGVIIQDSDALNERYYENPYHGELIQALEGHIREAGYFMMFHRVPNVEEGVKLVNMWNIEGVIISGATNSDVADWQCSIDAPMVFLDTYENDQTCAKLNVGVNDYQGSFDMVSYLAENQHHTIIFVAKGTTPDEWRGVDAMRAKGAADAAEKFGLDFIPIAVPSTYRNYQQTVDQLIAKIKGQDVTFFFASDLLAVQALSEFFKHAVQVPRDVSVVSFDGTPYASYATPALTTVYQDVNLKAIHAINLLIKTIRQEPCEEQHIQINPVIIKGQSIKIDNGFKK
ncbi:LacI family DNA-binding transcriptional regulator [Vagococcus vulneris]|uniref:HTH lacI-type domain-containing protein n=1 Tax=Vagococcus vulneris TaxID=1977869 RepID=A0A430A1E5_9ENTE|nr:LacI family DNA-binding transcriptional regulator [Vagococcus vulneris]RSU00216.1 hypothetical protein CBF37_02660 [Vagococcus vulneris]